MTKSYHFPLMALVSFVLTGTGCQWNPEPPPRASVVTPAAKQSSAQQPLRDARNYSSEADRIAAEAKVRLDAAKTGLEEYRGRVLSLTELVRKLRDQGSAAADDLKQLYDEMSKQDAYIEQMVNQLGAVQQDLTKERDLRIKADRSLTEANARVVAKEAEADTLRVQLSDAQATVLAMEKNAQENFEKAQKAATAAARMEGQRNLVVKVLIAVSVFLLISLIVNYIQFRSKSILPI